MPSSLTLTSDATLAPPKTTTLTSDAEVHLGLLLTSDAELLLTSENSTTLTSDAFLAYEFDLNLTSDALLEFEPEPPEPPTPPEPPPGPPPPATRTCAVVIDCPGVDTPVANFSSEGADPLIFVGTGWTPFDPYRPPKLGGGPVVGKDCFANSISAVSQEDADFIAYTQSQICQQNPGQPSYQTEEQTVCAPCPDGTQFCYTVPAFTFVSANGGGDVNAQIAAANAQALAYAERELSIMISRGACKRQTCSIKNSSPLPNGRLNIPYSYQFVVGGTFSQFGAHNTWSIASGHLPTGLHLSSFGKITGTPTSSGTYQFQVKLKCFGVLSTIKQFSIKIGSTTGLRAYWTLDEHHVLDPKIDKVTGISLDVSTSPPFSSPTLDGSGLYGYDISFKTPGIDSQLQSAITPDLAHPAGVGITFWFWLRYNNISSGPPVMFADLNLFDAVGNVVGGVALFLNGYSPTAYASDNSITVNASSLFPLPGVPHLWQLIALKYDGSHVFISVNNDPWVASSATVNIPGSYSGQLQVVGVVGTYSPIPVDFSIDEMGLTFKAITDAQLTQIYNGGAGVTWPAIQGIVPL